MSQLNLPACPICFAEDSLSRKTMKKDGQLFIWYECQRCGSVLLWMGEDQWAYQKIGREDKAYLLKREITFNDLRSLLPQVTEDSSIATARGMAREPIVEQNRKSTLSKLLPWLIGVCLLGFLSFVVVAVYQQADGIPFLTPSTPRPTSTPPCAGPELDQFLDDLQGLIERWDDKTELAGNTGRIALSPIVGEMQEIRREVQGLDEPWCAKETQLLMVEYMDEFIGGYLAFMAQESDSEVSKRFDVAEEKMDKAIAAWVELQLLSSPEK